MSDPRVRPVGQVASLDGLPVRVGVDYGTVTLSIGGRKAALESVQAGVFGQLYVQACWEAGQQSVMPL